MYPYPAQPTTGPDLPRRTRRTRSDKKRRIACLYAAAAYGVLALLVAAFAVSVVAEDAGAWPVLLPALVIGLGAAACARDCRSGIVLEHSGVRLRFFWRDQHVPWHQIADFEARWPAPERILIRLVDGSVRPTPVRCAERELLGQFIGPRGRPRIPGLPYSAIYPMLDELRTALTERRGGQWAASPELYAAGRRGTGHGRW